MTSPVDEQLAFSHAASRLSSLLQDLANKGVKQSRVAAMIGVKPQYLSDVKNGRRPLTELVARRLGEAFYVDYEWLLGISSDLNWGGISLAGVPRDLCRVLPLLSFPIAGEPKADPSWLGSSFEVFGVAAAKSSLAVQPYILRLSDRDIKGRLQIGDLLLISQTPNQSAEFNILRPQKKCHICRRGSKGAWVDIATGRKIAPDSPITGHCVGIIWAELYFPQST
jgi:transcriptional regulator with XRE-family HTH domain